MNGNDNVVIYTEEKEAVRSILNCILDYLGVKVVLTENSIQIHGPVSNELITNVIRKVIMEERTQVVTMKPERNEERIKSQEEKIQVEVEGDKETKKQKMTTENVNDTNEEKSTLTEQVYSYICVKREVTNAEVKDKFQLRSDHTYLILNKLYKEGKIEKVKRGVWRLEKTEEIKVSVKKVQKIEAKATESNKDKSFESLESLEKNIYYYISEKQHVKVKEVKEEFGLEASKISSILNRLKARNLVKNVSFGEWEVVKTKERQILELLENGWIMSEEEIAVKANIKLEELPEILEKMLETKKIRKLEGGYKIQEDFFGVFKQDEYKVLLDYIMSVARFSVGKIKSNYPEECHKLSKLIEEISPKYIREEKDAPGTYVVHSKGRILYFIMNHENTTYNAIKTNFSLLSGQEISTSIKIAIREGEIEKNKNGGYKVIRML